MDRLPIFKLRVLVVGLWLFLPAITKSQAFPELHAYETCTFNDGLMVVEVSPLANGITSRGIQTRNGTKQLNMKTGRRVMFAYPNTDFYANVKVEELPEQDYASQKELVLNGLDYVLASGDNTRNYNLPAKINGIEIHGMDRNKLEGGVLGMYVFFDDTQKIVSTIYFLNQEPEHRKFNSLPEYGRLRDQFLQTYTGCIRKNSTERKQ